jgi:methylglutaconyl-CoA hydratase
MIEINKQTSYWHIKLNRPDVHNAFHPEMIAAITEAYEAANDDKVKLVVLSGNGKSFSAGADLNWMKSMAKYSEKENFQDALKLFDMFQTIYDCSAVTVCVAHGNVFGGGLGFVAASDIVIAASDTKFCFSEVKWGLSPATISPFIRTKVNESYAKQWMLTADIFSATDALQAGLIYKSVTKDELAAEVKLLTKNVLENGSEALQATKQLLNSQGHNPLRCRKETAKLIAKRRVSKEGQEGLNYFLTKTLPSWKKIQEGVDL